MRKFVGIIGSGNIGRDPFDHKAWSGSSAYFFGACKSIGILERAFGVEVSKTSFLYHVLRNMSLNKATLREKFYLDPSYYDSLTEAVRRNLRNSDFENVMLQLGAFYDVPAIADGRTKCVSYNDGNIAQMMKSPYFDQKYRDFAMKALQWQKRVNENLDKIFTFSAYLRRSFIEDFGIPEERVVSLGVGANMAIPEVCPAKNDESFDILFLGKEFERKGGNRVVDAFVSIADKHKNARLIVIGPTTVPQKIQDCGHKNIIFDGFLSKENLKDVELLNSRLMKSKLAVLPSLYEPFGIAMIECQMHGMPCIAVNDWAFPEMIETGRNGHLLMSQSVEELAEIMDWYVQHPDETVAQGRTAYAFARENFGWDKVAQRLKSELEHL